MRGDKLSLCLCMLSCTGRWLADGPKVKPFGSAGGVEVSECCFCPNWKVSECVRVKIGKCKNQNVLELESVRNGKCQNRKVSEQESVRVSQNRIILKFFLTLFQIIISFRG